MGVKLYQSIHIIRFLLPPWAMAKRKDSDTGFLHSVSSLKKSSRTNKDYFVCSLQTSPSKFTHVVGFDQKHHERALHYNKTRSPLKLVGVKEQDGQQFINSINSN